MLLFLSYLFESWISIFIGISPGFDSSGAPRDNDRYIASLYYQSFGINDADNACVLCSPIMDSEKTERIMKLCLLITVMDDAENTCEAHTYVS